MDVVRRMFPGRVISRFGDIPWPPRSPDLTTCDFFCGDISNHMSTLTNLAPCPIWRRKSGRKWQQLIWDAGTRIRRFSAKAWKLLSRKWTPPAWHYLSFIICNSNGMQLRKFFCNKTAFSLKASEYWSFKKRPVPVGHPVHMILWKSSDFDIRYSRRSYIKCTGYIQLLFIQGKLDRMCLENLWR